MFTNLPTIAIVGGGALGASLASALVDRLTRASSRTKARIVLFEKSGHVGRGLAYAKDASPYLLNTSAQTMSLVPGKRSDFSAWLAQHGDPTNGAPHFCERQRFGDYAEACFARTREKASRRGVAVSTIRDEVIALTPRSAGGYRVTTREHPPVDADIVLLALGNLPSRKFRALHGAGFVASPYPSDALRTRVRADSNVAILGTGLSAIDAALALFSSGHERAVTMTSRGGMLPTVRGPLNDLTLVHVTRENVARATDHGRKPLRFTTILRWLELEFEAHGETVDWDRDFPAWAPPREHLAAQIAAAERGERTWQSIGEALNPMIEILWHHLAIEDRLLFLDQYRSRFMSHWVPIPVVTAKRVLALVDAGKLRVERLDGELRTGDFDVVVNATGVPRALDEIDSPLLDALARQGTIAAHEAGGVRVAFESLRVIGKDGRADPSLFAIGNLTCGTHLFTSTLDLNVEKADRIAEHALEELHRRIEKDPHVCATPHPT